MSCDANIRMLYTAGISNEVYTTMSLRQCLGVAAIKYDWVVLACYDTAVKECRLWKTDALEYVNPAKDGTLGNTVCKKLRTGELVIYTLYTYLFTKRS